MSLSVTPLPIEKIRKIAEEDKSLYVINYTDRGRQRNRGNLHISFVDESGASHGLIVPNTWIPIDLSVYASPKQLIKSQTFLGAFRNSDLICISESEARRILDSPKAKEESSSVAKKYANIAGLVGSESEAKIAIFNDSNSAAPPPVESAVDTVQETSVSDTAFNELVEKFNNNAISEADAMLTLNSLNPRPSEIALMKSLSTIKITTSVFYKKIAEILSGDPMDGNNQPNNYQEVTAQIVNRPTQQVDDFRS